MLLIKPSLVRWLNIDSQFSFYLTSLTFFTFIFLLFIKTQCRSSTAEITLNRNKGQYKAGNSNKHLLYNNIYPTLPSVTLYTRKLIFIVN